MPGGNAPLPAANPNAAFQNNVQVPTKAPTGQTPVTAPVATPAPPIVNPNAAFQTNVQGPAPVATAPNIASIYGNGLTQTEKDINGFVDQSRGTATTPIDEAKIRDNVQKQLQAETDALNKIYDDKLHQARIGGENLLGSNAAISARRGLLGSDFGVAQDQKVRSQNDSVYSGIDNERAAAIAALTSKGTSMVQSELSNKEAAKRNSTADYVNFLGEQEKRRAERVKQAVAHAVISKIDLSALSAGDLKAVADSYQISPDALINDFSDTKKTNDNLKQQQDIKNADEKRLQQTADAQAIKDRYITLSDGVNLYDTKTGQVVAQNPKNFAPARPTKPAAPKGLPAGQATNKATATRIVAGQGTLDELNPVQATGVKNELYIMGYGQNTKPPGWFSQIIKERDGVADPNVVAAEWTKENATIFKTTPKPAKGTKTTGGASTSGAATVNDL